MSLLERRHFLNIALGAFSAGCAGFLGACARPNPPLATVLSGSTVLALGDSLTFGTGASPETSYPAVLAQITGWNVINAGIPGEVSARTLRRLPRLLEKYNPHLVLTCIGTNDFFTRLPEDSIYANIFNICERIKTASTQQMLIAVPDFIRNPKMIPPLEDAPMYQRIAQALDIPLQQGALAQVLMQPGLRSDAIHANAKGYALFAQLIAQSLRTAGLWNGLSGNRT
ncbi:GDSL-type esterase/lipase family protein [Saezia sanguinis]|uniref:GDSL-type esterase/lipase family protein n=1 Tax=Saezia sanguinis TaxID=1965230 RepID=UPI00301F8CD9